MSSRPAAGGGRWVDVGPERLSKWIAGFRTRHGSVTVAPADGGGWISLVGADGAVATFHPNPGMVLPPPGDRADEAGPPSSLPARAGASLLDLDRFVAAAQERRVLGLLLARRNAVAMGVADGDKLIASKVETYYVQARTAAGGWSQQRYARRRDNQAAAAVRDAVETAVRVLLPHVAKLVAVVCGGDKPTVEAILADRRLAGLAELRSPRLLEVPEPRHAILVEAIAAARAVPIHLLDPPLPHPSPR